MFIDTACLRHLDIWSPPPHPEEIPECLAEPAEANNLAMVRVTDKHHRVTQVSGKSMTRTTLALPFELVLVGHHAGRNLAGVIRSP